MTPLDVVVDAHGIGGQSDLPIPLSLAIAGAVAALVVSFTVLVVAWQAPRWSSGVGEDADAGPEDAAEAGRSSRPSYVVAAARVLGMVLFLYTAATAVFGEDQLTNPFFGIVYVWWWVGLVFASALLGPVWRAISPMRTINLGLARISRGDPDRGVVEYPEWLGYWPAAVGLYTFVWMELVSESAVELGTVRLWCALYVAAMLIGGAVFGSRFYERADPFEVYSSLVGRLAPWQVVDGRVRARNPLAGLATTPPLPGLVAVVAVLFGSTAFDSFGESAYWVRTVQGAEELTKFQLDNLALLGFCVGAGALFAVGCALMGGAGSVPRSSFPRLLAHSIVPIVAGYIVAHYLTLFVDTGIQTLARASDPFGKGWDILGTASLAPTYWFSYHPSVLATIKVAAVVVGHVAAAVAAHDRAIGLLPRRHQITGQLPLLVVMVGYTAGGLYLLFNA